jgi:hypothetical protein
MSEQGKRSFKARPILDKVEFCGCYCCVQVYSPELIAEWEDEEQTAICPKCGIDSVIPFDKDLDNSIYYFRKKLQKYRGESF